MASLIQARFYNTAPLLNQAAILSKPKKRWQFAFTSVYCSRAFRPKLTPGTTHSAVHALPDDGFFNIDQPCLSELVKDKKLDQLEELGGVAGIASALKTDTKKGIQGDEEDLAHRRQAFGDNTYKKTPTKGFFRFVWEPLKELTIYFMLGWAALLLANGDMSDAAITFGSVFLILAGSAVGNFIRNRQLPKLIVR